MARPLVLLHDLGQTPPAWQEVVERLGARPMQAPWLRGLKPTESGEFDFAAAADAVFGQLDLKGIEEADLVGQGVGAAVAAKVAALGPDRIRHLVLLDPPAPPARRTLSVQLGLLKLLPRRVYENAGISKQRMLDAMAAAREIDLAAELKRIRVPTLVLVGSLAGRGVAAAHQVADAVAGARIEILTGVGAPLNLMSADQVAVQITSFVDIPQPPTGRGSSRT